MSRDLNNYTLLTTSYQSGLQIATGPCTLEAVTVGLASATTIGIIDGISGITVNVATVDANTVGRWLYPHLRLGTGLRIVVPKHLGSATVVWRAN